MNCPRCGGPITLAPGELFKVVPPEYIIGAFDKMTTPDRDPLLQEREKTHGSFSTNASCSQELKGIFRRYGVADGLTHPKSVHLEALDMIALKLSRILSGQANFKDHWDDIAGYAKLGSEACDG